MLPSHLLEHTLQIIFPSLILSPLSPPIFNNYIDECFIYPALMQLTLLQTGRGENI